MSKLQESFNNHKNFIAFVTANDPDLETTVKNVVALAEGGADVVEIGIPFSDPVADGPVIQKADLRALRDPDLPIQSIFKAVQEIRKQTKVPLVFLTYLNIVLQYGYEQFMHDCNQFGIDGVIIPDLPYEERGELDPYAKKYQIDLVPLITLNSDDRIPLIASKASGFIYLVSSLGVTGERDHFSKSIATVVEKIRQSTTVPIAVGFGIHSPEQAKEMAELSDGAIIGSACVKIVAQYKKDAPQNLKEYAQTIKHALLN